MKNELMKNKNEYRVVGDAAYLRIRRRNGDTYDAIVDVADLAKVAPYRWGVRVGRNGYLHVGTSVPGHNDEYIHLHRLILGTPEGLETKCLNGDRLDCRRRNWLVGDHGVVMAGARRRQLGAGRESGIRQRYPGGSYQVSVSYRGTRYGGSYPDLDAARVARDKLVQLVRGRLSRLKARQESRRGKQ